MPSDAELKRAVQGRSRAPAATSRPAYFGPAGWLDTPVIDRPDLAGGAQAGPLIVEEYDATTVIPPGCLAGLDEWGNIIIEIREGVRS